VLPTDETNDRNHFRFGAEALGHRHEVPRRPLRPAELRSQPGAEAAVRQYPLDRQQSPADADEVRQGPLDQLAEALRRRLHLLSDLGGQRRVIEVLRFFGLNRTWLFE
jgi:hypothetical protein